MAQQDNGFHFSRKSRVGALTLLGILLVFTVAWRLLPALQQPREDPEEKELLQAWQQFKETNQARTSPGSSARGEEHYASEDPATVRVHMAPFDPNTAGEEQLLALGLPLRTARTLIKYRSKGGKFRRAEDLQRLYTLSKEDYKRIAPYVHIDGETYNTPFSSSSALKENTEPAVIELNEADADALISLRGIGPGYSRRILTFRDALGGFFRVEQLQEVYGFPDSTYQQLKDKLRVDPEKVKKININTASEEELGKHPYIGRKLAAGMILLRNDLKNYSDIGQLRQVPLINEEKYRKIAPYLSTH